MATEERIAKIVSADLGYEDHGIFTLFATLDFGGSARQGVPGYSLDSYDSATKERVGTAYGMEWIIRFMRACGVREWSKVKGRTILAIYEDRILVGIKPLPTEGGAEFRFADLADMANAAAV